MPLESLRPLRRRLLRGTALSLPLCGALAFAAQAQDLANGAIEEIIVTSQRQAQSLQNVPIAVSAYDGDALERYQIEAVTDIQLSAPNVSFTKGNFTSTNMTIRGIGKPLTAASDDAGVGVHVNDVPLNSARLYEFEYYDLERVEVLRGPQGTLFGRNATGGAVNMITHKPTDRLEGSGEFEYGNYNSVKAKAMVNAPYENVGALRLSGLYLSRDGYTKNLYTGGRIDGRDLYSVRGALRLYPGENTTVDLMVSYFKEDDNRTRSQKQLCQRDPTGVLGCLPGKLAYELPNANSTLMGVLSSVELLTAAMAGRGVPLADALTIAQSVATTSMSAPDFNAGLVNPADMRVVETDFAPRYKTDETLVTLQIQHDFDDLTATLVAGYQDTGITSQQDYGMSANPPFAIPAGFEALNPLAYAQYYADGRFPISAVTNGKTGVIGGNILQQTASPNFAYDQSSQRSDQWSVEVRVNSNYDGPFNFLLGGIYFDYDNKNDYYVVASGMDYASFVLPAAQALPPALLSAYAASLRAGDPIGLPTNGVGLAAPYFDAQTDHYGLESWALFGEGYLQINDRLKLTGGLRYTVDTKTIRDRQPFYMVPVAIGARDANAALNANAASMFRDDEVRFKEVTGRLVLEWTPTADRLIYASYARGYKGGGFNPPFDPNLFPNTSPTFAPEFINAFEVGAKNRFLDGRLTANLTGFYYDYKGLQTSKIINRTSFNENIDAQIWGVEGEFLAAPAPAWLFNLNIAYLNTKVGDAQSFDPRDPTAGMPDLVLIKDLQTAANCVIKQNGGPAPTAANLAAMGAPAAAAGALGITPIEIPGLASPGAFGFCSALKEGYDALRDAGAPIPYDVTDGIPVDLEGNELQYSPNWQVSLGGQYRFDLGDGLMLIPRIDYYWQGDMWGRIYNAPTDKIDSWDVVNVQLTLSGDEEKWFVRAFVQNLADNDNVTGLYVSDAATGLFTNAFTIEPRRYGVAVGARF